MRWWWMALALSTLAASACSDPIGAAPAAAELPAATSPTVSDPPLSAPLTQRVLQRARRYRGNPAWLGAVAGGLLGIALGLGVVTLGLARRGPRAPGDQSRRAS